MLTDEDISGVKIDDETAAQNLEVSLQILDDDSYDSSKEAFEGGEIERNHDKLEDTFSKKTLGTWTLPKPGTGRPPIDFITQKGVCKDIAKAVRQL